jgi:hypothetical protein
MNTTASRPTRPLLPEDLDRSRSLTRAVCAHVLALRDRSGVDEIAAKVWPRDVAARALLTRSTSEPANIGSGEWGNELAAGSVLPAFIASLRASAGARLIGAGTKVDMPSSSILLPRASDNPEPSWIRLGQPIPVAQPVIADDVVLSGPRKLALIECASEEAASYTGATVEGLIGALMREAASKALDRSLFSDAVGDETRPPGLLNGVSATTSTSGGGIDALAGDVEGLIAGITDAGAGANILLFMAPARVAKALILAPGLASAIQVVPALTLADDDLVVAVDAGSFVSAFGPDPEFFVTRESAIHMESADPTPLVDDTISGGGLASPVRSLFQTFSVAIKIIIRASWIAKPGAVQFIDGDATW